MFDSTPPNLPVEPQSGINPTMPIKPSAKGPLPGAPGLGQPPAPMVSSSKKEPEDIFAGIEQGAKEEKENSAITQDFRERPSVLKWIAIVLTALIVLSGLGFAAWYFLIRIPSMEPEPVVLKEPMPAEQIEKPPVIEEPIIVETPPANLNIPPPVPITPGVSSATETSRENLQPTEGKDADADGLTDAEEILYGTDQTKKDTDDDGFMDGSEVMSLYSPTAKSWPLSAEQSMQKQTWKNWNFMIPGVWSLTEDPVFPERLIITTDESARIKVEAETLPPDSTLEQWAPANFQPYKSFSTKNGVQVLQPQSSLNVYYAALGDSILIVTYDLNGDLSFEYRTSLMMFINSLKR